MSKKHVIHYKHKNPTRMGYCNFGSYKDRTGKLHVYTDINGYKMENGFSTKQPRITLDISQEADVLLDDFLKGHGLIADGTWKRVDTLLEEEKQTEALVTSADTVLEAAQLTDSDVSKIAKLMGEKGSKKALRAKIIKLANENPIEFRKYNSDADKEHRIFLKEAEQAGMIKYINDVYKYNKETIGISEEQAIVWLKENRDIYALMKKNLKTELAK